MKIKESINQNLTIGSRLSVVSKNPLLRGYLW